jgi:hypothetical protein
LNWVSTFFSYFYVWQLRKSKVETIGDPVEQKKKKILIQKTILARSDSKNFCGSFGWRKRATEGERKRERERERKK